MLPKRLSLPYQKSLQIKRMGRRLEIDGLRMHFSPADQNTFLVTVPKKHIRLSTKRHRLKRLLHEALRVEELKLKIRGSFVIQIKKQLILKGVDEAGLLIAQLFTKADLY